MRVLGLCCGTPCRLSCYGEVLYDVMLCCGVVLWCRVVCYGEVLCCIVLFWCRVV